MHRIFLLAFLQVFAVVLGYTAICTACSGSETDAVAGPSRYPERLYSCALRKGVDSIYVVKSRREMYVYNGDSLLKIYRISLGDTPVGHKHFQGDERTPEGLYRIFDRNPQSICHKNLGISYPNDADRAYARKHGLPTGGDIKIHGLPNGQGHIGKGHIYSDWTNGCIAVTDEEVDELYAFVGKGIPILIAP
jgi:murein L,D-transpeptidase YafK